MKQQLNIKKSLGKALEWLEEKSGISAGNILNEESSYFELMQVRHLLRAVLCEGFRKGVVKRQLQVGGNSINNSLRHHEKSMESRVYQIMYNELRDYVYGNDLVVKIHSNELR